MPKKQDENKIKCWKCEKLKVNHKDNFYNSNHPLIAGEKLPICKKCINEYIGKDISDPGYADRVKIVLGLFNRPFDYSKWTEYGEDWSKYLTPISSLPQYKDLTYADSKFEYTTSPQPEESSDSNELNDSFIHKWGEGYTSEEYSAFERKYGMLKNNYQEKTAMHTEALLTYVRYRVKEELATAKGDSRAAKDWGALAKDAATAAKINPSQLSQSDLSDGLDNFGQLVRSVEQAVDIIPILPHFKERANDKVDFTIWCYINYIRDLKGLPLVSYEEIYDFYEQRKKEYELNSGDDE